MSRKKTILLSVLLSLPVILFLLHHYFYHSPELRPTGFTVDENVLYMSYAKQYTDSGHSSLFYSNPFDGDPSSPDIYFQPVNLLFVAALKAGIDPGLCFSLFGLLMAIACIYMGIRIIQHLLPGYDKQNFIATLFTWGGGLTALSGLLVSFVSSGYHRIEWLDGIFTADPANGWWGLNWGRTLFIPLEAWYHFLFLLNIYLVLKKKWETALLAAVFLSLSHPFTGIEYLLILMGWLLVEKLVYKNRSVPWWFAGGIFSITIVHCWYYLVYLNSFPEHRQLFSQYSAEWTYSLFVAIPAYCLVGGLSVFSVWKNGPLKKFVSVPHQRLFLCWAVIAFLLSKHEWFIQPMQPIHFTRGYTWAGLLLFALPGLTWLTDNLRINLLRKCIFAGFIFIFLSDNILWLTNILRKKETIEWEGHLSKDTEEVLLFLRKNTTTNDLLIGNAGLIFYMANVYTPANAWVSHPYNTPKRDERVGQMEEFLLNGTKPDAWRDRRVIIIVNKKGSQLNLSASNTNQKLFENTSYIIFTP